MTRLIMRLRDKNFSIELLTTSKEPGAVPAKRAIHTREEAVLRSYSAIAHQTKREPHRGPDHVSGAALASGPWRLSTSLELALNIFLKFSKESFNFCNLNFHLRERGFRRFADPHLLSGRNAMTPTVSR